MSFDNVPSLTSKFNIEEDLRIALTEKDFAVIKVYRWRFPREFNLIMCSWIKNLNQALFLEATICYCMNLQHNFAVRLCRYGGNQPWLKTATELIQ